MHTLTTSEELRFMDIIAIEIFATAALLLGHFSIVVWNRATRSRAR
jgi:hypothetical protein